MEGVTAQSSDEEIQAAIAAGERTEAETPHMDIVGEDTGEKRVLSVMNIVATNKRGRSWDRDKILEIATKHFEVHCSQIGWWPSGEYPDVVVNQREDGSWIATAYLRQSTYNKVKDFEDFPRVKVDTRTSEDVLKNRTSTGF